MRERKSESLGNSLFYALCGSDPPSFGLRSGHSLLSDGFTAALAPFGLSLARMLF